MAQEVTYGLNYLYEVIGKLYVDGTVFQQRVAQLEHQVAEAERPQPASVAESEAETGHQASPAGQDAAEPSTDEEMP